MGPDGVSIRDHCLKGANFFKRKKEVQKYTFLNKKKNAYEDLIIIWDETKCPCWISDHVRDLSLHFQRYFCPKCDIFNITFCFHQN